MAKKGRGKKGSGAAGGFILGAALGAVTGAVAGIFELKRVKKENATINRGIFRNCKSSL